MANKNKYKLVESFAIEHAEGISSQKLAEIVNAEYGTRYTAKEMQAFKKARGIKSGYRGIDKPLFSKEIEKYIFENHKGISPEEQRKVILKKFGKEYTREQVRNFYKRNKISSGIDTKFKKGNIPYNKGKKVECKGRMREYQFKKGMRPHNTDEVGTVVKRDDGYLQEKIAEPNVWKLKHILEWEKVNGAVPEGMVLVFKDGNKENTYIENLLLATRAELVEMSRNHCALRSSVPELTEAGHMVAKIRIKKREKKKSKKCV